jgi:hypothetical protein
LRHTKSFKHLPGSLLGLGVDLDIGAGWLFFVDGEVLDRHIVCILLMYISIAYSLVPFSMHAEGVSKAVKGRKE